MKMHLVMAHAVNFIQTPGTLPCVIPFLLAPDCMLCKHSTLLDVHQNMKRCYRSGDNKLTQLLGSHKLNNTRIMCSLSLTGYHCPLFLLIYVTFLCGDHHALNSSLSLPVHRVQGSNYTPFLYNRL